MAKELNEDTKFQISIKTLIGIAAGIAAGIGLWYTLQSDIEDAKKLPEPEISRTEYDLKDKLIRETIMNTKEQVEANGEKLDKIEQRLYDIVNDGNSK